MNESLVRVFLTLALEPLFPKAPAKTKTATFNTAAGGGNALNQAYINSVYKDSKVLVRGPVLGLIIHPSSPTFPSDGSLRGRVPPGLYMQLNRSGINTGNDTT